MWKQKTQAGGQILSHRTGHLHSDIVLSGFMSIAFESNCQNPSDAGIESN